MHRSVFFITALILLLAFPTLSQIHAGELPRIAVLDFRNNAGVKESEINYIVEVIRGSTREILPAKSFVIMTRDNMFELLPPDFTLSECLGDCAVETGRLLFADYIITGELVEIDTDLRILLHLYDTKSSNLLSIERGGADDISALEMLLQELTQNLLFPVTPTSPDLLRSRPGQLLAVVPFNDLTNDPDLAWLPNGIAESVQSDLCRIPLFKMVERTLINRLSRDHLLDSVELVDENDIREIGEMLGADLLLMGSIQHFGGTIRINSRLVETRTGQNLSSSKVTGKLEDIFSLQDQVITDIMSSLGFPTEAQVAQLEKSVQTNDIVAFEKFGKGLTALNEDDLKTAIKYFEDSISIDPEYVDAWSRLGTTLLKNGDNDGAFVALEKALDLDPSDDSIRFMLAQSYQISGFHDKAARLYSELTVNKNSLAGNPGSEMMILNLIQSKNYQEVVDLAPEVVLQGRVNNDNVFITTILTSLGIAYFEMGNYKGADLTFEIVRKELVLGSNIHRYDMNIVSKYLKRIRKKMSKKKSEGFVPASLVAYDIYCDARLEKVPGEKIKLLEESLEHCQALPLSHVELADTYYFALEDHAKARSAYVNAIQLDPSDYVALNNLAANCYHLKRMNEALLYFEKSVLVAPENYYEARFNLVLLLWGQEEIKERMPKLTKVLKECYRIDPEKSSNNGVKDLLVHLDIPFTE